jgi:hypothetical protein
MLRRFSASVRWIPAILVLALAACAEPPTRTAANDPYQACIERGYQIGNLPYRATTFYQSNVEDRIWPATRSPVAQCSEFRERGQL